MEPNPNKLTADCSAQLRMLQNGMLTAEQYQEQVQALIDNLEKQYDKQYEMLSKKTSQGDLDPLTLQALQLQMYSLVQQKQQLKQHQELVQQYTGPKDQQDKPKSSSSSSKDENNKGCSTMPVQQSQPMQPPPLPPSANEDLKDVVVFKKETTEDKDKDPPASLLTIYSRSVDLAKHLNSSILQVARDWVRNHPTATKEEKKPEPAIIINNNNNNNNNDVIEHHQHLNEQRKKQKRKRLWEKAPLHESGVELVDSLKNVRTHVLMDAHLLLMKRARKSDYQHQRQMKKSIHF